MKKRKVSNAVIRRLPRYYQTLDHLYKEGHVRISSSVLGNYMGMTAYQIRQDLSCFGEFGQQGYGYNVESLRREISEILGMSNAHTAVILGVGNLGRALTENFHFDRYGFQLTAAFDVSPELIGTVTSGLTIQPLEALDDFLKQNPTSVGILTVPRAAALPMAEKLIAGGVKGIWNFTNSDLALGREDVVVENVHFSDSLLTLSYLISEAT